LTLEIDTDIKGICGNTSLIKNSVNLSKMSFVTLIFL